MACPTRYRGATVSAAQLQLAADKRKTLVRVDQRRWS